MHNFWCDDVSTNSNSGRNSLCSIVVNCSVNFMVQVVQFHCMLLRVILYHPQFVLEHILEVPARVCQQWLEMRGVPATGVPLTPQPVIVFGLTV